MLWLALVPMFLIGVAVAVVPVMVGMVLEHRNTQRALAAGQAVGLAARQAAPVTLSPPAAPGVAADERVPAGRWPVPAELAA
jgi:hypothetical protein